MEQPDRNKMEIRGNYGLYKNVPVEKALAYFRFLQSDAGRAWREDVIAEQNQWEENISDLRRNNMGESYHCNH